MKRILSLNKRIVVILLIVFFVVFVAIGCLIAYENDKKGENSPFPNYIFQESWSCCSFAWLDDTLYSLRGIWSEEGQTFAPNGYELRKTNLTTCEDDILIDYIKGENIYLLANESDVYIAVIEVMYEKDMYGWEKPVLSCVDVYTIDGIKENKVLWHIEKDANTSFSGLFLYDNVLFITTTKEILSFNMKTGIENVLYASTDEIQNGYYKDTLIVQGEKLFFVEGTTISYINTKTNVVKRLAEISDILPPQDSAIIQKYWANKQYLYCWDESRKATVKIHVETGEVIPVSENRFYFGQANEYGIIVCEIPKENVSKYSTAYLTEMEYDSSISNDCFYTYNPEGELDFRTQHRHLLEAETAVLIGNRYFSYFDFHRQNGVLKVRNIKILPLRMRK